MAGLCLLGEAFAQGKGKRRHIWSGKPASGGMTIGEAQVAES